MEIPGPLPPVNTTTNNLTSLLKTLQPGQTLSATVTRQLANGHVELQIGQTRISSQPPLPLTTGQNLQLRVENASQQNIDLRILNSLQQVDTLSQALRDNLPRQAPLARALTQVFQALVNNETAREALPAPVRDTIRQLVNSIPDTRQLTQANTLQQVIQRSGARLEAQLQQLATGTSKSENIQGDLKANLVRAIHSLREQAGLQPSQAIHSHGLPTAATGQTQQAALQQPLSQSATSANNTASTNLLDRLLNLLAEGKPATLPTTGSSTNQSHGLTALLSRLPLLNLVRGSTTQQNPQSGSQQSPAIRAFISELIVQLESGLARMQSNQLASVPQDDNASRPLLLLDLPVNNGGKLEEVRVRIDHEQTGSMDDLQHIWRVSLYFDFDNLGVIRANISLHNNQVNTTFHSEQEGTSEVVKQHLDELKNNLQQAGLDTGLLKSMTINKIDPDQDLPGQSGIFYEKA